MVDFVQEETMFRILYIAIYAAFAIVRIYYRSQNLRRTSEKEYSQKTKSIIFLMLAILGYFLILGVWLLFPKAVDPFHLAIPPLIRWLGVGIALVAIALITWIHRTLGQQYSAKLEIQKEHRLIMAGPYSKVRHPMYSTFHLFSISVSFVTANLLLILFAIFIAIPFYWIARYEEKLLIDQFGERYIEYMKSTGRFFPRLNKF